MEICNDGHGEICHSGDYCPGCLLIETGDAEIKRLQGEINDYLDIIFSLEGEIEKLEEKLGAA